MSFFGFEQPNDLEEERRRIREGALNGRHEDLAVYTWGEESYDGLGDSEYFVEGRWRLGCWRRELDISREYGVRRCVELSERLGPRAKLP